MSGHKRAAAALHSLSELERESMLRELPAADQEILRAHLRELRELGFEAQPGLQLNAEDVRRMTEQEPELNLDAQAKSGLHSASARHLLACLEGEPPVLLARLLQAGPWPWQDEFLSLLDVQNRLQVQRFLHDKQQLPAPHLQAVLCDLVEERLLSTPRPRVVPPLPEKRPNGMWGKVGRWFGAAGGRG